VLELGRARLGDRLDELGLGDDHPVARVAEQVFDLLGRGRVVDRERGRAEVRGRHVADVELGAVDEHQRDRVPAPDAERGEAGRDRAHALGVLAVGDRDAVVGRTQRHAVGVLLRRDLEGLTDRRRLQRPDSLLHAALHRRHAVLPLCRKSGPARLTGWGVLVYVVARVPVPIGQLTPVPPIPQ
jgi:hypothetical protein